MATLFWIDVSWISRHLKNIFEEWELDENVVIAFFANTTEHWAISGKTQTNQVKYYNLDVIISLWYRVNSIQATRFRQWATQRLKEYLIKGFTMDDERLKGTGGGDYWKELLSRIRDIRSSEKALYRQVLDLYATSIDYDKNSEITLEFFKVVQNKLHYATNLHTAAETIYERADATKDFMGLTTFAWAMPRLSDVKVAKNYLTKEELLRLNNMVSAFFDLAELKAEEHVPMKMEDWVQELDKFLWMYWKGVLTDAWKISRDQAVEKATSEYRKYQAENLSPVEKDYLESIKWLEKKATSALKKNK